MARRSHAEPIYKAVEVWRDECLIGGGSVFQGPGLELWTAEGVLALQKAFAGNPPPGEEAFLEKLRRQLHGQWSQVTRLAAEMLWVLFLFPRKLLSTERKREIVTTVWGWSGSPLDPGHPLLKDELLAGIGSAGTAYNTQRDRELKALIQATLVLQSRGEELASSLPWEVAADLDQVSAVARRNIRDVLLHLLFPGAFERIASAGAKRKIAAAFAHVLPKDAEVNPHGSPVEVDQTLFAIRAALQSARPGREVDFYDDPELRARWDIEKKPDLNDHAWAGLSLASRLAERIGAPEPDAGLVLVAFLLLADNPAVWSHSSRELAGVLRRQEPGGSGIDFLLSRIGLEPGVDASTSTEPFVLPPKLADVVRHAEEIRRVVAVSPDGLPVSARHVLAALLGPEDRYRLGSFLDGKGRDVGALRAALLRAVERRAEQESLEAWRRLLTAEPAPVAEVPVYAGYDSDALAKEDRLGVTRDVEALCSVLAARKSRPPLSVGLFGDWGTGKSFFMERMRERIDLLARASRGEPASAYYSDVVQVWFNAWHYMDANLWANLAARIFEGLAEHLDRNGSEEERRNLFSGLEESRGVLAEAVAEREDATRRLEAVTAERERLEGSLAASAGSALRAAVVKVEGDPEVQQKLDDAADRLGISRTRVRAGDAGALLRDLASLGGRLRVVFRRPVRAAVSVGVFAAFVALAWLLADRVEGWSWIARATAALSTGLVALSGVLKWMTARVSPAVAWLEEVSGRVERERERREEERRQEETRARRALSALEEEEARARARVEALEREIEEMRAGRRLNRFILERNASAEYRRHLGVVNLIRNDFQKLSDLLTGAREDRVEGLPSIDRIVLYVDDLDRCPEDRVVEVLQAVHLLLAFPLFVVVVGVDSRWLLLSLEDHYATLRGRGGGAAEEADWSTTPQSYLEKIFQIPFTLRPMESAGFGSLVQSLLPLAPREEPVTIVPAVERVPDSAGESEGEGEEEEYEEREQVRTPPMSGAPPGPRLDPAHLHVEPWERDLVEKLHPLIASPRGLKRFTNVYRFIRAQQEGDALERFRGSKDHPGEFQAAAVLLAALVGHPAEATALLRRVLSAPEGGSWWGLVESLEPPPPSGDGHPRRGLREALLAVRPHLAADPPLSTYARWAREVARFSFQSGRILGAPSG